MAQTQIANAASVQSDNAPYVYFGGSFTSTPASSAQMGGAAIWNFNTSSWAGALPRDLFHGLCRRPLIVRRCALQGLFARVFSIDNARMTLFAVNYFEQVH